MTENYIENLQLSIKNDGKLSTEIKEDIQKKEYDTLVLSGGSIYGIAVLGALQYAYDNFFLQNVTRYFGTSSGAMICYLLIIGYTPIEIMVYICTNQIIEKMYENVNFSGLLEGTLSVSDFKYISDNLEIMTVKKTGKLLTLGDLKEKYNKNLTVTTYNATKGIKEYISSDSHPNIPCLIALRMTSNIPFIFEPYKYNMEFYIDGAFCDNFPLKPAIRENSKILSINLACNNHKIKDARDLTKLQFVLNLLRITVFSKSKLITELYKDKSDIITIHTNLDNIFKINSTKKLEMFSNGFNASKDYFENK